jgi:hypothetical protein
VGNHSLQTSHFTLWEHQRLRRTYVFKDGKYLAVSILLVIPEHLS